MRHLVIALLLLTSTAYAYDCDAFYDLFSANFSDFSSSSYVASPGSAMQFSFMLSADSKHVNDGTLRVQVIYRPGGHWGEAFSNYGDAVVDDFYLDEKVNLKQGSKKRFGFEWSVPETAPTGEYAAVLYLYEGPFQVGGAAFSPNMYSSSLWFSVQGADSRAFFQRNNISVSGRHYNPQNTLSILREQKETLYVEVPIINEGPEREANVSYSLHTWERLKHLRLSQEQLSGPLLNAFANASLSDSEYLPLPADSTTPFWVELGTLPPAAYLLTLQLTWNDSSEFLYVRIPVTGEKADFAYAGLSDFPAMPGNNATIDLCFQLTAYPAPTGATESAGGLASEVTTPPSIPVRVYVELMGADGTTVVSENFDATATPNPSSLQIPFSSVPVFRAGFLRAKIISETGLLDSVTVPFDYSQYHDTKELSVSTQVWENGISYAILFHDDLDYPEQANVTLYLLDQKTSGVLRTRNLEFTGDVSGYFEVAPGEYVVDVTEHSAGLSDSSNITVPAPASRKGQDYSLLLAVAILLLAATAAWRLRRK